VIAFLAALNVKGTQESTRLNLFLAVADLITQAVLVVIGMAWSSADVLVTMSTSGGAELGDFLLGSRSG